MDSVTDPGPWVRAVRASHDRLVGIVASLDSAGLRKQSYDTDWSIAQVLSHLGSGAEIFQLNLHAGLTGGEPPSADDFRAIWDVWNGRSPDDQAAESIDANESLVTRVEALSAEEIAAFRVPMFGMTMDLAGLLRMRLSEHAVHTWDVAVALDPAARVSHEAVELLLPGLPQMMPWLGKKGADPAVIAVTTTDPAGTYTLDTGGVTLTPGPGDAATAGSLDLTAEALLRLVYGRLDESVVAPGEVRASGVSLPGLRAVFPGF
ncbi:maleylpyruvate isomerase family mycothiol-dependent enzyme [Trebonia sp.]|uniref:maleylpyruvate isomerase family mycothiol-dependent enzyme n=1 Tax=Trebonia sp. TaxID=2767075 RepID=UPI00262C2020|nr:maleylpyruvate isomerase family mycothiol-dependent enzyme [Trebonia sp.]